MSQSLTAEHLLNLMAGWESRRGPRYLALADPFRPSGELALTVAQRAGDLRVAAKRAARREQRKARAAAKAAKTAVAA